MKMALFLLMGTAVFHSAVGSASFAETIKPTVKLLWVPTNRAATNGVLTSEFEKEVYAAGATYQVKPHLEMTTAPSTAGQHPNPFGITDKDFNTGWFLTRKGQPQGPVPTIEPIDATWFDTQVANKNLPEVFEIGGHHVISEGWHSDNEHQFMFHPTFLKTLETYPSARAMFDEVKLAVLWGCNTMTNLEPHAQPGDFKGAQEGDYLSPTQIGDPTQIGELYNSGSRLRMIGIIKPGAAPKLNSLEFYKQRLASEYGPNSPRFEYTRKASQENCSGPYQDCPITDLERIMPDKFLFDGTHRFNEPWRMKRIFRHAYLVLGFSSASPSEEARARILQTTIDNARIALNKDKSGHPIASTDLSYIRNVLYTITNKDTPTALRKRVIQEVRKQWTIATFKMNRNRPSGSITPAFPDLDQNGVFNTVVSKDTPVHAPYEGRDAAHASEEPTIQLH